MTISDSPRLAAFASAGAAALLLASLFGSSGCTREQGGIKFRRISTQFIAAPSDPAARSGADARSWGIWTLDPGPRGVKLDRYDVLAAGGGLAPAQWKFDGADWWLEEHGLIMEQPRFPVPPGRYLVTGGREVAAVLTIHPPDGKGEPRWELSDGATIADVTHLACRSARYTPASAGAACSPSKASQGEFPVAPGAAMPPVEGCKKQDYSVLLLIGVAADGGSGT